MSSRREFLTLGLGSACLLPWSTGRGALHGSEPVQAAAPVPTPLTPRVRRAITSLSAAGRRQYVDGVLALKATQSPLDPSLCYYDQLVHFHREAVRYARVTLGYAVAHQTPAFLPWHRKYMLLFEDAVRRVAFPDFALPYWDWTDPSSADTLFADDFMGPAIGDPGDNYAVTVGPFRKGQFPLNLTPMPIGDGDLDNQCPFNFLTRGSKRIDLPTAREVADLMALTRYSAPPYDISVDYSESFNNTMLGIPQEEGGAPFLHSAVHAYVGGSWDGVYWDHAFHRKTVTYSGSMAVLDASPNDPIFFLHHCNVDRLWAEWQRVNGSVYEPESGYNRYFNVNDRFYPFLEYADNPLMTATGLTPGSMLDIGPLGFTYDTLQA